jgi:hypothetical protein
MLVRVAGAVTIVNATDVALVVLLLPEPQVGFDEDEGAFSLAPARLGPAKSFSPSILDVRRRRRRARLRARPGERGQHSRWRASTRARCHGGSRSGRTRRTCVPPWRRGPD